MSTLPAMSMAVVRSHIWMLPLLWPLNRYRRGREPMRLEPSHSWTMKAVMEVPSTERTSHTLTDKRGARGQIERTAPTGSTTDASHLFPLDDSLTYSLSVSGTTLWMNTCWSSLSPYGPETPGDLESCDLKTYTLLAVTLRVRGTDLRPGAAAAVSVHVVQAEDLEGGERRGARLGGDHPSEPGHRPRPHVIVVGTN